MCSKKCKKHAASAGEWRGMVVHLVKKKLLTIQKKRIRKHGDKIDLNNNEHCSFKARLIPLLILFLPYFSSYCSDG